LRALGFTNINAKAEGIEGKPAFREAFQRRRCLVPVDSFYEWKKTAEGKEPYAIVPADRGLMALAGRWEGEPCYCWSLAWSPPVRERRDHLGFSTRRMRHLLFQISHFGRQHGRSYRVVSTRDFRINVKLKYDSFAR
jgi:SOS response associated peptidase (SRAP)